MLRRPTPVKKTDTFDGADDDGDVGVASRQVGRFDLDSVDVGLDPRTAREYDVVVVAGSVCIVIGRMIGSGKSV